MSKKPTKAKQSKALRRLRKFWPNVNKIVEARQPLLISVTEEDSKQGRKKDPAGCALVRACQRLKIAEHALIGIGNSYLIKGNVATRYKTSNTVSREITSFDRHQDFATGRDYRLSAISPKGTLGEMIKSNNKRTEERREYFKKRAQERGWKDSEAKPPIAVHHNIHRTARVRKLVKF